MEQKWEYLTIGFTSKALYGGFLVTIWQYLPSPAHIANPNFWGMDQSARYTPGSVLTH